MNTNTDLTFFTNEPGSTLLDRFKQTLKDVRFFDVLVGYFRTSGFNAMCESFEDVEKIRILVGINVDPKTHTLIEDSRIGDGLDFESHKRTKEIFSDSLGKEMDHSPDTHEVELGAKKFIDFLQSGKMEIKAYPSGDIHAKVYISRFKECDRDFGRVITGSSNFSESGLVEKREFNVELKNSADVKFALDKFEELWKDAVDITKEYIETINQRTWLNDQITPYQLYLKFLYEYLKEDINLDDDIESYLPEGFMNLQYQKQAVVSAKKILDAYNGVFLADVVGLGKTYVAAMLTQQLQGKILVICPPVLKTYWEDTFFDFGVRGYKVESLGKLEDIIDEGVEKFDYVIVDEAHRFRNEITMGYEQLHQICFGKKVILVSATPLNNKFEDIFSQLKLFQVPKKSTIPGISNLEKFFSILRARINQYDKDEPEYFQAVRDGSKDIREKLFKYIMVRRTRTEISNHFGDDMKRQGLFFSGITDPSRIIYKFDKQIETVFDETIELLKKVSYSRYTPLLNLKKALPEFELQSQRNLGGFMKTILIKRLESSFHAFKKTLRRFVESYEQFIKMYEKGTVYISKKVNVYDLLDNDNEEKLFELVQQDKVQKYEVSEFTDEFTGKLKNDLIFLQKIESLWLDVNQDPKLREFLDELSTNKILKDKKLIVFTESKETGDYLYENLKKQFPKEVLFYSSAGAVYERLDGEQEADRLIIKQNFDPGSKKQKDGIRILITTDILAEGINLHRSNIVINYDLPWNPTKVLQRVGRVNRVGTKHKTIHIFNFFPTDQSKAKGELDLEENIKAKIQAFHDTLGEDARYLTEEEQYTSHGLFGDYLYKKLTDKKTFEGEQEDECSELEYLKLLRDLRDQNPSLFEKIKNLPKKARSSKPMEMPETDSLATYFRTGKLKKFFIANGLESKEITFFEAVDLFKCDETVKRLAIPKEYYSLLSKNKSAFELATSEETYEKQSRHGTSNETYIAKRMKANEFKNFQGFTDDDDDFIKSLLSAFDSGIIPRNISKRIKGLIEKEQNPIKVLWILRNNIPTNLLDSSIMHQPVQSSQAREVILSLYLKGG
ncbi:MAG: helicase-related protein [Bacteroidota bacterium]|nr:helicase-related protein [Bacteroidota bacterium]